MTPWEVIQEALLRKRPVRNLQWLADQVGVSIQVVSNWKARGVPAKRFRDVAAVLDLTIDQIEGIAPLPWDSETPTARSEFSEEARQVALDIDSLPKKQRDWVLMTVQQAIELARETIVTAPSASQQQSVLPQPSPKVMKRR